MKNIIYLLALVITFNSYSQKESIKLTNAIVVGQLDKGEDRYAIEINLTELLVEEGVKAVPSLNILKLGSDASLIATDSIQKIVAAKAIDTYILISVRGYDRKFKKSQHTEDFNTALNAGNLFPLHRDEITSITFEFLFYRNGKFVGSDLVKCGNISDRNSVIKRFRKLVKKRIVKKWKK